MNQSIFRTLMLVSSVFVGISASRALGHESFQDALKETYKLKSFSCKTCHPDSDDKKIRSKFAELIHQELKDKKLSEKFAVAEKDGEEAVKKFEKDAAKDFIKAWEIVSQKQMTFDELIRSGLFNGARIDEKLTNEEGKSGEKAKPKSSEKSEDSEDDKSESAK